MPCLSLVPDKPAYPDQEFFGDSAYSSKEINTKLKERGFLPMVNERAYRNKPLTEDQKATNKVKSTSVQRKLQIFFVTH